MDLKQTVTARQQLALSPRLYQSLKVLRLSAHELKDLIQRELDENPTLEMPEPADFDLDLSRAGALAPGEDLWRDLAAAGRGEEAPSRLDPMRAGARGAVADLAATPVSLSDHLTVQLHLIRLPEGERRAALAIIGSLDEDGYLREPVSGIAETVGLPVADIEAALRVVQGFDPPGVAARSLEECLGIQLEQINAGPVARQIVESQLPQVARGAYKEIAKTLSVPVPRVERAVGLIRSLNPSPGSLFDANPPAAAVIPDVYISMERGRIRALANKEIQPSLSISRLYRQMAEDSKKGAAVADEETVRYIKTRIRDASRLIRDIDQRRVTVTRVASAIAAAQPEFFAKGPDYLRPLSLDDIARRLDVHPSTISRAILGKYMSTPFGIFEFRYFFSSGYAARGAGIAATAVKKRLQKIVMEEDARRPLSDQKLAELLKKEDIPISRRTITKYREEIGIASSRDRKKRA